MGLMSTSNRDKDQAKVLFIELVNTTEFIEDLIHFFFLFHDPTTLNWQGFDSGIAYASLPFYFNLEQVAIVN
jgi:peptide-methionine (S)-S-oxide reductase